MNYPGAGEGGPKHNTVEKHKAMAGEACSPEILVVDDNAALAQMLAVALTRDGLAVRLAAGGQQAVELYRQHHHTIAVVLLDVQMPSQDGAETLRMLQAINPQVRCCFMSASTGKYSIKELLALGAVCFLPKPFSSLADVS